MLGSFVIPMYPSKVLVQFQLLPTEPNNAYIHTHAHTHTVSSDKNKIESIMCATLTFLAAEFSDLACFAWQISDYFVFPPTV